MYTVHRYKLQYEGQLSQNDITHKSYFIFRNISRPISKENKYYEILF